MGNEQAVLCAAGTVPGGDLAEVERGAVGGEKNACCATSTARRRRRGRGAYCSCPVAPSERAACLPVCAPPISVLDRRPSRAAPRPWQVERAAPPVPWALGGQAGRARISGHSPAMVPRRSVGNKCAAVRFTVPASSPRWRLSSCPAPPSPWKRSAHRTSGLSVSLGSPNTWRWGPQHLQRILVGSPAPPLLGALAHGATRGDADHAGARSGGGHVHRVGGRSRPPAVRCRVSSVLAHAAPYGRRALAGSRSRRAPNWMPWRSLDETPLGTPSNSTSSTSLGARRSTRSTFSRLVDSGERWISASVDHHRRAEMRTQVGPARHRARERIRSR